MKAGVAALVAGQAPVAAVLFAVDVADLVAAYKALFIPKAADPLDPNYTQLATAVPIDMPELDALPDGPWKQYGEDSLMLLADQAAEVTSENRAQGAVAAGSFTWQSNQLAAASGFASDAAAESATLQSLYTSVVGPYIEQTLVPDASSVVPYLQANGLPAMVVKYLGEQGWSTDDLSTLLQASIAAGTDELEVADGTPNALALSSMALASVAQEDMDQATQISVSDLRGAGPDSHRPGAGDSGLPAGGNHGAGSEASAGRCPTRSRARSPRTCRASTRRSRRRIIPRRSRTISASASKRW